MPKSTNRARIFLHVFVLDFDVKINLLEKVNFRYFCAGKRLDEDLQDPREGVFELPSNPGGPLPERCAVPQFCPRSGRHTVHPRPSQLTSLGGQSNNILDCCCFYL